MTIEHLALWTQDLEKMKAFYERYYQAEAGDKYHNPAKQFTSYFLSFGSGCRLELMHSPAISGAIGSLQEQRLGLAHFAVSVGSKEKVDALTETLRQAGYQVAGEPRTTGDGYYESLVLDPEQNRVEITV